MKIGTNFHLYLNFEISKRFLPKPLTSFNLSRINNIKASFLPHLKSTHVLSAPKRNFTYSRINHIQEKKNHPKPSQSFNFIPNNIIIIFSIFYRIFIGFNLKFLCLFRSRVFFGDYMRDRCRDDYYPIAAQSITSQGPKQQNTVSTSTSTDLVDHHMSNSLLITPPSSLQLHQLPNSMSSSTTTTTSHHQQQNLTSSVRYTVQRVVSTSQLQQLTSNYANNSASSLNSIIVRSETDCGLPNNGE